MENIKKIMVLLVASVFLVLSTGQAEASAYQGYNTIGSYQQYGYQGAYQSGYSYEAGVAPGGQVSFADPRYNYQTTPRAGGTFGSGSAWITGLRQPFYADVTPVHFSSVFRPTSGGHYGNQGYGGNYGYDFEETRFDVGFGFY